MSTKKKTKKKVSKKQLKKKRQKRILMAEFGILLILLVVLFGWTKFGKLNITTLKNLATNDLDQETKELLSGYTTVAFFGVDNRSNGKYESGNSDSIMICNINNDTKEVKIVSVYRDTMMDVDGNGKLRKCNYAYNHGGVSESMEMLNRNLDLDIQKYVAVDFYALADAIDSVGGITLPEPLTAEEAQYTNEYVPEVAFIVGKERTEVVEGQTEMNGVQAVSYCRVRYTAGGDFKRASRQRTVVQALITKVKGSNIIELNNLIDHVFPNVSTNFTQQQIIGMATAMQDYELVDSHGFPFDMKTGTFGKIGSVDVPCTLESNVNKLYEFLYGETTHVASNQLKSISQDIQEYTGYSEGDALDYGF